MDRLIDEVALRCNDSQFEDFKKTIYSRVLLRTTREIAKKYEILERVIVLTNKNTSENTPIYLTIPSFNTEYKVYVNNTLFLKSDTLTDNTYTLSFINNKLTFNYSPKTGDDKILFYYLADINESDYDLEETVPVIPTKYEEVLIEACCIEIAKLGIPKFGESEKGKKYYQIINLYNKDIDFSLLNKKAWVGIKLWNPF